MRIIMGSFRLVSVNSLHLFNYLPLSHFGNFIFDTCDLFLTTPQYIKYHPRLVSKGWPNECTVRYQNWCNFLLYVIYKSIIWNGTAMNARESENYLAISRSSSAYKSVEIFWAEIYRGRLFYRAESSLIQSNCRSLRNFKS